VAAPLTRHGRAVASVFDLLGRNLRLLRALAIVGAPIWSQWPCLGSRWRPAPWCRSPASPHQQQIRKTLGSMTPSRELSDALH